MGSKERTADDSGMTFGRDFASVTNNLEFEQPVFHVTTIIEKSEDIMKTN